jgi:hypothetical protein
MEAYIDQQGLSKYRGRIVPRNSHTSSWLSVLDLRMSQELPIWRKARGVLTIDIENFANMIDSDWGQLRQVSFAYFTPVVDVDRIDSATNRYVYRPRSGQTGPVAPSESLSACASSSGRSSSACASVPTESFELGATAAPISFPARRRRLARLGGGNPRRKRTGNAPTRC